MDDENIKDMIGGEMDPRLRKCIDDCNRAYQAAAETLKHCTEMGGVHADPKHLMLLKDCMDICKISEDFMLRGSAHAKCVADECAKICEACAESCESIDPNDPQMKECAKVCRECATSCRDMPA